MLINSYSNTTLVKVKCGPIWIAWEKADKIQIQHLLKLNNKDESRYVLFIRIQIQHLLKLNVIR